MVIDRMYGLKVDKYHCQRKVTWMTQESTVAYP